jgi:DNA-directed RNA polymerase subunit RPC12/RpoP
MAGSAFHWLRPFVLDIITVQALHKSIVQWLKPLTTQAEVDLRAPSRGCHDVDHIDHQVPSARLNWTYTNSASNSEQSTQHRFRSRSPRLQSDGIQAQHPFNPDELQAMYGFVSRMMTTMGWYIGETLGRAPHGGLVTALSNGCQTFDCSGVGSLYASASTSTTSPRLQQIDSDSARVAATVAKATEAELCHTGMQAVCPMDEVVEYRCRRHCHTHCHRQLVQTDRMQCPVCGDSIIVMEAQQSAVDADEALGHEFYEGAYGTAEILPRRQMTATLRRCAAFTRPNVAKVMSLGCGVFSDIGRTSPHWSVVSCRKKAYQIVEEICTPFTAKADAYGGQSATGIIHVWARVSESRHEVACNGSSVAALYYMLVNALSELGRQQRWRVTSSKYQGSSATSLGPSTRLAGL